MNQTHLFVATEQWLPWIRITGACCEFMPQILYLIRQVTSLFLCPKFDAVTRFEDLPTANGEADLALGPFALTDERFQVAHFSSPIYMDSVAILTRQVLSKGVAFKLLNIFTLEIWFSILAALLIVCASLTCLNGFFVTTYPVTETIVKFYSSLLSQSVSYPKEGMRMKFLFGFWLLFSANIVAFMKCQILSSLVTRLGDNVDTFDDLLKTTLKPMIECGGAMQTFLYSSRDDTIIKLRERIEFNSGKMSQKNLQKETTLDRIHRGTHAIIAEFTSVQWILSKLSGRFNTNTLDGEGACGFHVGKSTSRFLTMALAYRKDLNPALSNKLKLLTASIMDSGNVIFWLKGFTYNATNCLSESRKNAHKRQATRIETAAIADVVNIWIIGVICSCVSFSAEYAYGRYWLGIKRVRVKVQGESQSVETARAPSSTSGLSQTVHLRTKLNEVTSTGDVME